MTKLELIEKIPRYVNGLRRGLPRTERLREIELLLNKYKFSDDELSFFDREIGEYELRRLNRLEVLRQRRMEELEDKP